MLALLKISYRDMKKEINLSFKIKNVSFVMPSSEMFLIPPQVVFSFDSQEERDKAFDKVSDFMLKNYHGNYHEFWKNSNSVTTFNINLPINPKKPSFIKITTE